MASDVVIAMALVCVAGRRGARDAQGKKQLHPPPPSPLAQNVLSRFAHALARFPRFLRLALSN